MPYINDPSELAMSPALISDIEIEEPRDYHDYFWDDQQLGSAKYADNSYGIHVQRCVFDDSGDHLYMAKDCPHFELEDEEGPRIQQGWTVQQGYGS